MQIDKKPSTSEIMYRAFPPNIMGLMILQIAVLNIAIVAACVFLGRFADAQFGTQPWLTSVGALVGSIASVYASYKVGIRTVAKTRDAYEKWKQQTQSIASDNKIENNP